MIAEKASDMIKEDWAEAGEPPSCLLQYRHEPNDGNPTKVEVHFKPDVFNETAELYSYLSLDHVNEKKERSKATDVSPEKHESGVRRNENEVAKEVTGNKAVNNYIPQASNPYFINPSYMLQPYPPPLFYYPVPSTNIPDLNTGFTYQNPYNNPNINVGSIANQIPYPLSKFNHKPNQGANRMFFDSETTNQEQPVYYETKDVLTPEGRKCKVWLYYDGTKYEVII